MLEDFNSDASCYEAYVSVESILKQYKIMVTEPTNLERGLFDHV